MRTRYILNDEDFLFIGFPNTMLFRHTGDYRAFCQLAKTSGFPLRAYLRNELGETQVFIKSENGVTASIISFDKPIERNAHFVDFIST